MLGAKTWLPWRHFWVTSLGVAWTRVCLSQVGSQWRDTSGQNPVEALEVTPAKTCHGCLEGHAILVLIKSPVTDPAHLKFGFNHKGQNNMTNIPTGTLPYLSGPSRNHTASTLQRVLLALRAMQQPGCKMLQNRMQYFRAGVAGGQWDLA